LDILDTLLSCIPLSYLFNAFLSVQFSFLFKGTFFVGLSLSSAWLLPRVGLFLLSLQARNLAGTKFGHKPLDSPGGIHILYLTGKEGMACIANVNFYLRLRASGNESVPTTAGNLRLVIRRMDPLFHRDLLTILLLVLVRTC
jgi:hypothetical protein